MYAPQGVAFLEPIRGYQGQITHFRYRVANPAFAQLFGATSQELTGHLVDELLPAGPETKLFQQLVNVLQTSQSQQLLEHDPRRYTWLELTLTPMDETELILLTVQQVTQPSGLSPAQAPEIATGFPHQSPSGLTR